MNDDSERYLALDRGEYIRFDRDPVGAYSLHVTGLDDVSSEHHSEPTGYVGACSWCWFGYSHSEDAHAARLARHAEKKKGAVS